MTEEYVDPEFPEMESPLEDIHEFEDNSGSETSDGCFYEDPPVSDELRQQVDLELIESSPDAQEVFSNIGYVSQLPETVNQDSGEVLFLPEDDPIQQPVTLELLDTRLVYTRSVPKRLRHLTCERKGAEYQRPVGLYRPGG